MFKSSLITALVTLASVVCQAQSAAQKTISISECVIQAKQSSSLETVINAKGMKKSNFVLGQVQDIMAGELDPHVLGDGALLTIKSKSGTFIVLEANQEAPISSAIDANKMEGLSLVAIDKSCVMSVRSKSTRKAMIDLAEKFMSAQGPYRMLTFK